MFAPMYPMDVVMTTFDCIFFSPGSEFHVGYHLGDGVVVVVDEVDVFLSPSSPLLRLLPLQHHVKVGHGGVSVDGLSAPVHVEGTVVVRAVVSTGRGLAGTSSLGTLFADCRKGWSQGLVTNSILFC